MSDLILCSVSSDGAWASHVNEGFSCAKQNLMIDASAKLKSSFRVFSNSSIGCSDIDLLDPTTAMSRIIPSGPIEDLWISRRDLFEEIARWVCAKENYGVGGWLVCEAGYSKIGDPILMERPHISYEGKPFLLCTTELWGEFLSVLKWGRSYRFVGVLQRGKIPDEVFPIKKGVFICDAFDGDSLMMADFS